MTSKQILIEWLRAKLNLEFQYHDIEQDVPAFGANYYGKMHNASNYAREFRKIRENKKELRSAGIDIVEVPTESVAGKWKVIKIEEERKEIEEKDEDEVKYVI